MRESPRDFGVHKNATVINIHTSEIVVAERTQEPYLLAFRYRGENIASTALGELVGFFEIEQHDQDAAYIVNFLASVAKKEYFANPRRPVSESFEAALHRINVALSELVKHGNVSWLGHVSGTVAAFVGNTLHFSVTGDGALLLWRAETLRTISEGLVETGSEPHPLKTFVEIASGEIRAGDRFFVCSPSLWTLFTPVDIERALARFTPDAFQQFLRTALVNELRSAVVLSIECTESVVPLPTTRSPKSAKRPLNAFSETTFLTPSSKSLPSAPIVATTDGQKPEFTDSKTGHIYVQGEEVDTPSSSRGAQTLQLLQHVTSLWKNSHAYRKRSARKFRKWFLGCAQSFEVLTSHIARLGRRVGIQGGRWLRQQWHRGRASYQARERLTVTQPSLPQPIRPTVSALRENTENRSMASAIQVAQSWLKSMQTLAISTGKKIGFWFQGYRLSMRTWWLGLSRRTHIGIVTGIGLALISLGIWSNIPRDQAPPQMPAPSTNISAPPEIPPAPTAPALTHAETVLSLPTTERIIDIAYLGDVAYLITEHTLFDLSNGKRFPTPKPVNHVSAMRDLHAFFCLAADGTLSLFTPSTGVFTDNTLPLPAGTHVTSLGSFLTYLYVLDAKAAMIYRFPRSEGSFGAPTTWLKEKRTFDDDAQILVSDALFVRNSNTIARLERGKTVISAFETAPDSARLPDFVLAPENQFIYALDTLGKRLLRWSSDGKFSAAFTWETDLNPEAFTVAPDMRSVLFVSDGRVLRFPLPENSPEKE